METNFKKLLENIRLTDRQEEDVQTKICNVCKVLHANYYPTRQYDGSTKLLIGSYGKQTNIRPPKDIDVLFRMPESEFQRIDNLSGNKQSQLLQEIRNLLKDKFSTTEEIKAFGKVIVISFSEGTHTVELLPAWELPSGFFKIPDTESGGSWDIWNPLAELSNIDTSNAKTKCTRSLIKMLKCWTRYCNVPMPSFIIEILAVDYLEEKPDSQADISYPQLILGFFEFLKARKNSTIFSPASGALIDIGEDWSSRAESAYSRAEKAVAFEAEGELRNASIEWQKIFGVDFPLAEDKAITENFDVKIAYLTSEYPSAKEENITDTYGIPIDIIPEYRVDIDAEVTQNGFRPGWLGDFLARGFPLLKGKKLKFKIKKINVPYPYNIMWKVRNFGDEARSAGGLRGEITHDAGYGRKEENTLYYGEHYVECYVIKDGKCVTVSKILVPIGNDYD